MTRIKYSKKIEKLIKEGNSLRSIRIKKKLFEKNKKGQLIRIKNIIIGVVSSIVSITIFIFASPILKSLIEDMETTNPVVRFIFTAIPFLIFLLIFVGLTMAFRGDSY